MDISDVFSWGVIKWVLIVLVAGFIGQFGKSFALHVIAWVRRKKKSEPDEARTPGEEKSLYPVAPSGEKQILQENKPPSDSKAAAAALKLKKKEAKALLKAKKKEAKRKTE
jgi:hypothetical protein